MAAETGFMIDGQLYEVPDLGSFTMDEIQVMYDYSGLTLEDFVDEEDEGPDEVAEREAKLRNPGFFRALMHIAYQRGNPKIPTSHVKRLISSANVLASWQTLAVQKDDDPAVPLESTSEPNAASQNDSLVNESLTEPSPESSGNGSKTISASEPDATPPPTTALKSGTSSISSQELSAA